MTEYWVSQARHWCEYCKIYINGSKSSIAFHEQGRKHKEIVELFLKDMRKRNRERKIERQDLDRELAKIERDAAKAYQQQDNAGQRPRQAVGRRGSPSSATWASRYAKNSARASSRSVAKRRGLIATRACG